MQIRNGELIEGRYRVEHEAIVAGFAQGAAPVRLYNAIDEQLERPVTLQFLSADNARDPQQLQRFVRHGQLAAALHHPTVAGVYDAGEWNGWPYWVMARLGDTTLDRLYNHQSQAPGIGLSLHITRCVAEALQAVRDVGMTSWTFSHQAVRVSGSGDPCLYPIEGLEGVAGPDGEYTSSRPEDDPHALSGMLRLMLLGSPDPRATGTPTPSLPAHVLALLDRIYLNAAPDKLTSAGAVAAAIAEIEASAVQPTEAYDPARPPQAEAMALVMPYYGPPDDAPLSYSAPAPAHAAAGVGAVVPSRGPDAPTLAAPVPVAQETRATAPVLVQPYVPPAQTQPHTSSSRPRLLSVLPLLALLLLAGVAALWPRLQTASGSAPNSQPAATADLVQLITVPDVRGKSLEEANSVIGFAGLSLRQAEPAFDGTFSADTVAQQVPGPTTPLPPGSPVTITLSLGPEPTPVPVQPTQPPAAEPNPQPPAPAAQPRPPENEPQPEPPRKQEKKDKEQDKEKDDEGDD